VGSVEGWVYYIEVVIVKREGAVLGVNLKHPIITVGLCDAALPKLLWARLVYLYDQTLFGRVGL